MDIWGYARQGNLEKVKESLKVPQNVTKTRWVKIIFEWFSLVFEQLVFFLLLLLFVVCASLELLHYIELQLLGMQKLFNCL